MNQEERRTIQIHTYVTEDEEKKLQERMQETGISNRAAYLRKMALNGYIIRLDVKEIREMSRLLRNCSNNLNQYAKKANQTGSIYGADIEDLQARMDELMGDMNHLIEGLANIL